MKYSLILLAVLTAYLALPVAAVQALNCKECLGIEADKRTVSRELQDKSAQLKKAFEGREYAKVKTLNAEITELRKRLIKLRESDRECRDACTPEAVKENECSKLKLKIAELEGKGNLNEDEIREIDRMYTDLRRCDIELRRLSEGM